MCIYHFFNRKTKLDYPLAAFFPKRILMSESKMLKNERKNRQKAFVITMVFYLVSFGGIMAYSSGMDISSHLPEQVKEWLQIEDQEKDTKVPRV